MTRRCTLPLLSLVVAVALGAPAAQANHGAPVSTFGTNGTSIVDLPGGGESINDLVADTVPIIEPAPAGSSFCVKGSTCTIVTGFRTVLLAAGVDRSFADAAFAVERFDANGQLDASFGVGGRVRTPFEAGEASAAGVAVMPDGRFVVAGDIDISGSQGELVAVARYRPDGTLDSTFSGDGKVNARFPGAEHFTVSAVALQSDGRIVVGGTVLEADGDSAFGVMRFTAGGALDTTFGSLRGAETTTSPQQFNTAGNHAATLNDILVDPLDRIVAVGDMALFGGFRVLAAVRYVPGGLRNANFTSDGIVMLNVPTTFVETAEAVVRQSDGRLVLGGWGNVRLSDGRVRSRMIAARFTDVGALDTTFTTNGFSVDALAGEGFYETHALFYDPQRQTILAGGFARPDSQASLGDQFAFIRYGSTGLPDTLFDGDGRMLQNLTTGNDHVNAIVSEIGGTLVAGGFANESASVAGSSMLALGGYHGDEDRIAPGVHGAIRSHRLAKVRSRKRLAVDVELTEAGAVRVAVKLAGGRRLGRVDIAFSAAGKQTARVPLTARGRRALAGRRRARIVVRLAARDQHGNRAARRVTRLLR
jgi:uncharacterized delta-60 repeat protein